MVDVSKHLIQESFLSLTSDIQSKIVLIPGYAHPRPATVLL